MKSPHRQYKDDHRGEARNTPLSFTAEQQIFPNQQTSITFAAEHLENESINKLIFLKTDILGLSKYLGGQLKSIKRELKLLV